ncbi:MAG: methyltransferase domain-containing protein [Halobacteria archaeon]
MPFAMEDRTAFLERVGVAPDERPLDYGPDGFLSLLLKERTEKPVAACGPRAERLRWLPEEVRAAVCDPSKMGFRSGHFDSLWSYQSLHGVPGEALGDWAREAFRVVRAEGKIALLLLHFAPKSPGQKAAKALAELLEEAGLLHRHDPLKMEQWLHRAGFKEISLERVERSVRVPDGWVRSHIEWAGEAARKARRLEAMAKAYQETAKQHGEELLPAVQIAAKKPS